MSEAEKFLEEMRARLAHERRLGHGRMVTVGMGAYEIEAALAFAEQMHSEQLLCMARSPGLVDAVVMH